SKCWGFELCRFSGNTSPHFIWQSEVAFLTVYENCSHGDQIGFTKIRLGKTRFRWSIIIFSSSYKLNGSSMS
ncbi:hypothetical protein GIB67_015384, partial [Kingdonia uniflora]